jgi:Protein of unknown function (DUF3096)
MTSSKSYCPCVAKQRRRSGYYFKEKQDMSLTLVTITPLVALIAGVLILIMPRLLNYIVAIYLIVIGVIGLAAHIK